MDSLDSRVMLNTAWDLDDSRFIDVEATRRLRQPIESTLIIYTLSIDQEKNSFLLLTTFFKIKWEI